MVEPPYVDDPTVADDDSVLRRVPTGQYVEDPKTRTGLRPSSGAFDNSSDGSPLSASLASQCQYPNVLIRGYQGAGLVSVSVRLLRQLGQGIVRDPTEADPAHVLVFGSKPRSFGSKVAKAAEWVVNPRSG